jgi:hypothetical protein
MMITGSGLQSASKLQTKPVTTKAKIIFTACTCTVSSF